MNVTPLLDQPLRALTDTVPDDEVALYLSRRSLGSEADTFPVTAPVTALAALNPTPVITGAGLALAFAVANATRVAAAGFTGSPVLVVAAAGTTAVVTPSSRRTAASIVHEIADCTGAGAVPPSNAEGTDSTTALAGVDVEVELAIITGAAETSTEATASALGTGRAAACSTTRGGTEI
ncbi:MAG: hypothetical protein KIH64_003060 [Mycobacterium sp.]|nr:hypothetical protein [Mycobacterium sp.]